MQDALFEMLKTVGAKLKALQALAEMYADVYHRQLQRFINGAHFGQNKTEVSG